MKKFLLLLAPLALVLGGCQSAGKPDSFGQSIKETLSEDSAISMSRSMKGYELYSWQSGEEWKFVVVEGANSLKTFDQITSQPFVVTGYDALINQLRAMARGEEVFWNLKRINGFSLPPDELVAKVTAYCRTRGIRLNVIGW